MGVRRLFSRGAKTYYLSKKHLKTYYFPLKKSKRYYFGRPGGSRAPSCPPLRTPMITLTSSSFHYKKENLRNLVSTRMSNECWSATIKAETENKANVFGQQGRLDFEELNKIKFFFFSQIHDLEGLQTFHLQGILHLQHHLQLTHGHMWQKFFLNNFLVCPIWLPIFSFFSNIEWTRIGCRNRSWHSFDTTSI